MKKNKGKGKEIAPSVLALSSSAAFPAIPPHFQTADPQSVLFRPRPRVSFLGPDPSSDLHFVHLHHPENDCEFLAFPAYDYVEENFGLHHETALTACTIVAFNHPGYLSLHRERDATRIPLSQILLAPDVYYYHLADNSETGEFYGICTDFRTWPYPHNLPPSWSAPPPKDHGIDELTNWTAKSDAIKARDVACLISGSLEGLVAANIVPREENDWLKKNRMQAYHGSTGPLNEEPANLLTLRADLHQTFDTGQFSIVPKGGQLVVHFLRKSRENAKLFHNNVFDDKGCLSRDALYARFAWSLFKQLKIAGVKSDMFKPSGTRGVTDPKPGSGQAEGGDEEEDGGGDDPRKKRKRKDGGSGGGGGVRRGQDEGTSKTKRRIQEAPEDQNSDTKLLQPNDWLFDVLKMAPAESQTSLDADMHDIENDLKIAARNHPFFVNPSIAPTPHEFYNIVWYPGMDVVERKKMAYIASHPNIGAHSGLLMEDDGEGDSDNDSE